MEKIGSVLNSDLVGKVIVCCYTVVEVTSVRFEEIGIKPYLDDDAESYPDDYTYFDNNMLLDYGFTLMSKEEADEIFKPFFDLKNKQKVAV